MKWWENCAVWSLKHSVGGEVEATTSRNSVSCLSLPHEQPRLIIAKIILYGESRYTYTRREQMTHKFLCRICSFSMVSSPLTIHSWFRLRNVVDHPAAEREAEPEVPANSSDSHAKISLSNEQPDDRLMLYQYIPKQFSSSPQMLGIVTEKHL